LLRLSAASGLVLATQKLGGITERGTSINRMRFPVVLFDLDGTVIDSGAIILASMRHAAKEVLGTDVPDEKLMAAVGGPGLEAQMRTLAPDRVEELVTVYRAHNEPLHDDLECCAGMEDVLVRLKDEGRRLGIVTAKRRQTVELAFARLPIEHLFETVVGGDETERHKPDPQPLLLALERLDARPEEAAYVGDAPFDIKAAKAAGLFAVGVTWGGIHARERLEAEGPDALIDTPEELLGHL
jgi:pyrophosphatase PpaX